MTMNATLTYSDNAFATIEVSAVEALNNEAVIKGSKGEITVSSRQMNIIHNEISFFYLNSALWRGKLPSSHRR